jgi:hypothetical protein
MQYLKYMGPLQQVEVQGYGHFGHGDEKQVDTVTAGGFKDPRCAAEGWEVRDDKDALTVSKLTDTPQLDSEPTETK